MKKILVTHANFQGAVELVYGDAGVGENAWPPLLVVDFRGGVLADGQKYRLLQCMPLHYGPGFEQSWGLNAGLQFSDVDMEIDFEKDFWIPYGQKLNRKRSENWWNRASKLKRLKAVTKLPAYERYLSRKQWMNKANPETYLNDEYFETDWDNVQ